MRIHQIIRVCLFVLAAASMLPCSARADSIEWTAQYGSSGFERVNGVSADGLGNVYISGYTSGDLDGSNAGSFDGFLSKLDDTGALLWTRQQGSSAYDSYEQVSADGLGNVFVGGYTQGDINGTNAGGYDAFVSMYDGDGTLQWTRQLGTTETDRYYGVAADGMGNVYLSGYTDGNLSGTTSGGADAIVSKFDSTGSLLWSQQFGSSSGDFGGHATVDGSGNVYIAGYTLGDLDGTNAGSRDAFISKFSAAGAHQWTRQFGTNQDDVAVTPALDGAGSIYVTGRTEGDLNGTNAGGIDVFLSKYNDAGDHIWTQQRGSVEWDQSIGATADGEGNIYISGKTEGDLAGTHAGGSGTNANDAFLMKFDASGNTPWAEQFGTTSNDELNALSADGNGNVYLGGSVGSSDVYVIKIRTIPSTEVDTGTSASGQVGGGSENTGGLDATFDEVTSGGTLNAAFDQVPTGNIAEVMEAIATGASTINFELPTDPVQFWDIDFDGNFTGDVELTFGYNETALRPGQLEEYLQIRHYVDGFGWMQLTKTGQDLVANTITVVTDSFSPFSLAGDAAPDPGDMNGDGNVTAADVSLFVEALVNREAFQAHGFLYDVNYVGDVNADGTFDLGDLSAFSSLVLSSSSSSAVPEPNSIVLTVVVAAMAVGRRRNRADNGLQPLGSQAQPSR